MMWVLACSFWIYWRVVDLLCCINFCCITKWLSYEHIYIFFHVLFCCALLLDIDYSSLCYPVGPCFLYILHTCLHLVLACSSTLYTMYICIFSGANIWAIVKGINTEETTCLCSVSFMSVRENSSKREADYFHSVGAGFLKCHYF